MKTSRQTKKRELTPEQKEVMEHKGTEAPFTGKYVYNKESGIYTCAKCGYELFSSDSKFDSGTGWPSFDAPIKKDGKDTVKQKIDMSHGMIRTEVICPNCGSHLGHVFSDGPTKTRKRFCINSCTLDFKKA